jgi:hypothetical protein
MKELQAFIQLAHAQELLLPRFKGTMDFPRVHKALGQVNGTCVKWA